jgi:hypothetical protein
VMTISSTTMITSTALPLQAAELEDCKFSIMGSECCRNNVPGTDRNVAQQLTQLHQDLRKHLRNPVSA